MTTGSAAAGPRTNVRWFPILFLVLLGTTINYLDRAIFGIASGAGMPEELGLTETQLGLLASAFSLTYAFAQIPGGIFLDRFGTRLTYGISLAGWSLFVGLQGVAHNFASLFGYRLGMGLAEAPCFPANSRILATWFPQHERARANSIYAVGQYAGIAFLSVPLVWITNQLGWRALFIIAGVVGIALAFYFYGKYHEPQDSKTANEAELEYIRAGGALASSTSKAKFEWANVWKVFKLKPVMVASLAMYCNNTVLVFFLYSFVRYLSTEREMAFLTAGVWAALPFIGAAVGVLVGGQISDRLLQSKGPNVGRKLPITIGFFLAACIVFAAFVPLGEQFNTLVIGIMCVAFFGQGILNLGWTVISDTAPKELLGTCGGVFNFVTNLTGIFTPIIIGIIVDATGTYNAALMYVGAMPLIGAFLYMFVLGDIKRQEIPD